jgi:GNAT superfamily N-acetyltransferase
MDYRTVTAEADIAAAGVLALRQHERLREVLGFLPERTDAQLAARIARAVDRGTVVGAYVGDQLVAFLGAFHIPNYRNAGEGAYGPDWCHGFAESLDPASTLRELYRELASALVAQGVRIHSFGFYASERERLETMYAMGFGQMVVDAAIGTEDLAEALSDVSTETQLRRAEQSDAQALSRLNHELARHIGASPIFLPDPTGMSPDEWAEWLADDSHVAVIACEEDEPIGYIKAQEPQFDVTFAVQHQTTLSINGMYVAPTRRRRRVGAELLGELTRTAARMDRSVVSVDFETANAEAHGFWLRWFRPVTYSLERRV